MATLPRVALRARISEAIARSPAVALTGPRQVGKTTLARTFLSPSSAAYFDLEHPVDLARLQQPLTALGGLSGLIVIDEVQRAPDLFPVLRVLIDRDRSDARFLLLGSASPAMLRQSNESLAGRIEVHEVPPFGLAEVGSTELSRLWLRGGFPRSYLASSETASRAWRRSFVRTFIERDLPELTMNVPAETMRRFWTMLAHLHGQVWNAAAPARALGIGETTVRRYLNALMGTFMVRQLPAWHENLGKRQVKAPKVYVRDTGLLHELLGIASADGLLTHPRSGASWEGFALEEVIRSVEPDEVYFWAVHEGSELDLLVFKDGRRLGFEFKRADAPALTRSMRIALSDLRLDHLFVIYPGDRPYSLDERVDVLPLAQLAAGAPGLGGG